MRSVSPQLDGTSSPGHGSLSASQQRFWVLEGLHPRSPALNVTLGIRLTGPIATENLRSAWFEVVRLHDILQTGFHEVEGVPKAIMGQSLTPSWSALDVEGASPEERELRLARLAREEAQRLFDLSRAPLLRASLWRLSPLEHVFLLVAHRIACDEASLEVLLRQLALHYSAGLNSETTAMHAPMQYSDFVSRQGEVSEEQLSYWKRQLAGIPASLDLPTDRPRSPEQTFQGASQVFVIENPLLEQLRNFGKGQGATLFMTLLAAFNVLLSRYSRQEEIVVGTAVSGRGDPTLASLVGPIENTVALRSDLSDAPSFVELLTGIRDVTEAAFSHQAVRFEVLLEELPLERDLTRNPVFQVAFNHRQAPVYRCWAGGITATAFYVQSETELFDLSLNLIESADSVEGRLSYNTDLFDAATIVRMKGHFQVLLKSAAYNPSAETSRMPLLTDGERHQLLVEWNDTTVEYPVVDCVHQLVEAQIKRTPNAVAVVFNDQSLTYDELNQRANQIAHYLVARGVQAGSRVAIFMDRSLNMLVAVLAILKSGAAYVPLDPAYPRDRLAFMLSDSSPTVVLTQEKMLDQLPPDAANTICVDTTWDDIAKQSAENIQGGATRENLVYVIYTSGSTGKPKGVCLSHRALTNLIFWQLDNSHLPQESRTIQFTSLSFDVSFQEIFSTWCSGGTLVAISESLRRDPYGLLRFLREENIARLFLPFVALQHLSEMAQDEETLPNHLLEVVTAGEQLRVTRQLADFFRRMPQCSLYNHYGPSETHVVTSFKMTGTADTWSSLPAIGKPIANTQIYILDPFLNPVPAAVSGELYIGGVSLADGYLNQPELTKERFIPDPFPVLLELAFTSRVTWLGCCLTATSSV